MIVEKMCEVCDLPVPERAHQDPSARTCGPTCASTLFKRENPDFAHRFFPNDDLKK